MQVSPRPCYLRGVQAIRVPRSFRFCSGHVNMKVSQQKVAVHNSSLNVVCYSLLQTLASLYNRYSRRKIVLSTCSFSKHISTDLLYGYIISMTRISGGQRLTPVTLVSLCNSYVNLSPEIQSRKYINNNDRLTTSTPLVSSYVEY